MYFWPTHQGNNQFTFSQPLNVTYKVRLKVQRYLDTFINVDDCPDLPQEWIMPLAFAVARYQAPKFGLPAEDYNRIVREAELLYQRAFGFDNESETSIHMQPDTYQYYRY